ncbi:hypothetical protein [Kitasatospora paracochleata]|uniref:LPXTG-motif cell wall-anchored protein n=1 Tax=Kitasatospora paracochleata TaxID=58354 RepID=A0ABT1J991_9ACTN|nr:hypothetical protein [Kitasatospora paracochleata]MCP2313633.1 hypothetical protein [Kitasatospora paracochleata]
MRTSAISASARNVHAFSARRRLATVAAVAVLAGGVQFLGTDSAWACEGPYRANNPIISNEAQQRHHSAAPAADFVQPAPLTLAAGSPTEIGVEFANTSGAEFDAAAPTLTLKDAGGKQRLRLKDVTVEVMRDGAWQKLGIDDGCGGEAIRVDTSPLMQHLPDGRAARALFRVGLAAGAPTDLTALSVTTSAFAEVTGTGTAHSTTVEVTHPDTEPVAVTPATDRTAAPATPSSAPTTPAPVGTAELARTGPGTPTGLLAAPAAALAALGTGILIVARRRRTHR